MGDTTVSLRSRIGSAGDRCDWRGRGEFVELRPRVASLVRQPANPREGYAPEVKSDAWRNLMVEGDGKRIAIETERKPMALLFTRCWPPPLYPYRSRSSDPHHRGGAIASPLAEVVADISKSGAARFRRLDETSERAAQP
jgi:hypothetical protein